MIESGSHVTGLDWASFGIPTGTAIRYERPAEPLRRYFPSYVVMDSDARYNGEAAWLLPGGAKVWIVLAEAPIATQVRNRVYAAMGQAVLYGPTSRASPINATGGGVSIVLDVGPLGWGRWFDGEAEEYRDRITPLQELWSAHRVEALIERLHDSDRGPGVKAIIDAFLLEDMPPPVASEDLVARATALLADPNMSSSGDVAKALGISAQTLLRLCRRHFGFGPKLLMRRRRFLRRLVAMLMANELPGETAPPGYHDVPHFVRDGKDFLGVTPRQLLQMPQSYLRAALRVRAAIIGAPWAMLDIPD